MLLMRKLAPDDEAAKTEYYTCLALGRTDLSFLAPDLRYHFIRMVSRLIPDGEQDGDASGEHPAERGLLKDISHPPRKKLQAVQLHDLTPDRSLSLLTPFLAVVDTPLIPTLCNKNLVL